MTEDFRKRYSFKQRSDEAERIRVKYPDRVPVIVEKSKGSDVEDIDRRKFLVPDDLTAGQFLYILRKRIKLSQDKAMFMFVNNTIPPTSTLMSQLYKEHKDADKFLYITYSGESCFGMDFYR